MHKKVLSEIALYSGPIQCPKGFEINRTQIKNDILQSYAIKKRLSDNSKDYSYLDYFIPYSPPLAWFKDYIRDHFNGEYLKTLIPKAQWGNVYKHDQQSFLRNTIEPLNLRESADYTLVYGVDMGDQSADIVVEYDDNRRANRSWQIPMRNDFFVLFPSTQKYFITPNRSKQLNVLLTITYEVL
jgi:hypothetical protein